MSKVSVIVPVYNMSQYIDTCVQSLICQSYADFTLILIDDGSNDDSLTKCMKWKQEDSRIVVVSKTNEGLGPTRNLGVRMAETQYISFLDADDWWDKDYLRLMMRGAEIGDADIVLCDMNYVYTKSDGTYMHHTSVLRFPTGRLDLSKEKNLINRARTFMCGKLFRKRLFTKYDVEQPSHAYEDVATTPYLIARAKTMYYVPYGLYFYLRDRQGSIINNFQSVRELLHSLQELYQKFQDGGLLTRFYPSLRQLFWGQFIYICRNMENRFSSKELEDREQIKTDAKKVICKYFPELESMFYYTFGIPSNQFIIIEALQKLIVDEQSILCGDAAKKADIVISTTSESHNYLGKTIQISFPNLPLQDEERAAWDLADVIFDQIWHDC